MCVAVPSKGTKAASSVGSMGMRMPGGGCRRLRQPSERPQLCQAALSPQREEMAHEPRVLHPISVTATARVEHPLAERCPRAEHDTLGQTEPRRSPE
eukprot:scaffold59308_cov34-Phaeocystis_antarctica.AAC.3